MLSRRDAANNKYISNHSAKRTLAAPLGAALLLASLLSLQASRADLPITLQATQAETPGSVLSRFDRPFLFAYGTWEKRVRVENGHALLRGEGVTPRGGAGCNVMLDLSGQGGNCPTLRVRVGVGNKMPALRLMLRDTAEHTATWEFALPPAGKEFTLVTPRDGASLALPNALDKPGSKLDLAHIMQWQVSGDWSSDQAADVEISEIRITTPDAAILAQRKVRAAQTASEQNKARQEQDALRQKYGRRTANSPVLEAVSLAAPDILALTIQAGKVIPGSFTLYQPQPGDEKRPKDRQVILVRGGQEIGWLIGPNRDHLVAFEKLEGDPLLEHIADAPETYKITSRDDAAYASGLPPAAVYRKSKPTDWAQPARGFAMRHVVYLKSPRPFTPGKTYVVSVGDLNLQTPAVTFRCDPTKMRSEAVHVSQIGYRPDDPGKRAFLSVWLGTGGAVKFPDGLRFSLLDGTGKSVYNGKIALAKAADEPEAMWKSKNFNLTNVYCMDFGEFKTPGTYRVCVEGVGCSYPFEIGARTWEKAFLTQMQGLYNERSGVALGPPYTDFLKPRDFHPADGVKVFESTYSALEKGGEAWADLVKGNTGKPVPNAWGGYHDAGDWNPRRVTHTKVTMAQLELLELFPQRYAALKLRIPPTPGIPDMLTEAMFEVDCFRRLQKPDGGVPFGIETDGDPIDGEVSWMQSMPAYVYAPDIWSSYAYASVAARLARLLKPYNANLARIYQDTALKAMHWAEADYARRKAEGSLAKLRWEARDERNMAALQLYQTTGDKHWHGVFLENTCLKDPNAPVFAWGDHVQRDQAFSYARLNDQMADPNIRRNARQAVLGEADKALVYAAGNAFNLTTPDKGKPMFLGFYSVPDAIELARAHFLTGKTEYLGGAVQACQFPSGCNPNNMTYTTGLGANPVRHPLHLDSRRTGQPAPPGLTPYGNIDFSQWNDNFTTWPITYYLNAICTPKPFDWPTTEAFFDIFLYPAQTEFTVDMWTPNVYVWGYLAARK